MKNTYAVCHCQTHCKEDYAVCYCQLHGEEFEDMLCLSASLTAKNILLCSFIKCASGAEVV